MDPREIEKRVEAYLSGDKRALDELPGEIKTAVDAVLSRRSREETAARSYR